MGLASFAGPAGAGLARRYAPPLGAGSAGGMTSSRK